MALGLRRLSNLLPATLLLLLIFQIFPVSVHSEPTMSISEILVSPGFYEKSRVTIEGRVVDIQTKLASWRDLKLADVFTLADDTGKIEVYSPCGLSLWVPGTYVRVNGQVEQLRTSVVIRIIEYPFTIPSHPIPSRCFEVLR